MKSRIEKQMTTEQALETLVKKFPDGIHTILTEQDAIFNLKILYRCDPEKNTECTKETCQNPCTETCKKKFAKLDENGEPIRTKAFLEQRITKH